MALPTEPVNGRTALYQQIQDAKDKSKPNPWIGVMARMDEKTRRTFDGFNSLLRNHGWEYNWSKHDFILDDSNIIDNDLHLKQIDDLIVNQQSKIYDDVRNQTIMLEVMKKPGRLETAMPMVNLLKMKSKYPKEHPKYNAEDERLVLTSRLRKFLTKVEAGTLLSDEAKRNKKRTSP